MSPLAALLGAQGLFGLFFLAAWGSRIREIRRTHDAPEGALRAPTAAGLGVGAVTNFFDTLGIGSFATTTTFYRLMGSVDDRLLPGTLNVGHTLPTLFQAFIYIVVIDVDVVTLVAMVAAATIGAWLGARIVAGLSRRHVQLGLGSALVVAAGIMVARQLELVPGGGDALGVTGVRLALAVAGNFLLGALMTLGIGLYAPCMMLVSLLGMNPRAAFPIMMGSCAFLMPVASARFVRAGAYDLRASLGLALGGPPAVLVAAFLVRELPLDWVKWLVVIVITFTGINLVRAGVRGSDE